MQIQTQMFILINYEDKINELCGFKTINDLMGLLPIVLLTGVLEADSARDNLRSQHPICSPTRVLKRLPILLLTTFCPLVWGWKAVDFNLVPRYAPRSSKNNW